MKRWLIILIALAVWKALAIPVPWLSSLPHTNLVENHCTNDIILTWCQPSNTVAHLYMTTNLLEGFGTNYVCIAEPTNLFLPYDECFFKVSIVCE